MAGLFSANVGIMEKPFVVSPTVPEKVVICLVESVCCEKPVTSEKKSAKTGSTTVLQVLNFMILAVRLIRGQR